MKNMWKSYINEFKLHQLSVDKINKSNVLPKSDPPQHKFWSSAFGGGGGGGVGGR